MPDHIVSNLTVESTLRAQKSASNFRSQITAAGTLQLVSTDAGVQIFTGAVAGQVVRLPDATTLIPGTVFELINDSSVSVVVQNSAGALLGAISQTRRLTALLTNNGTAAGSWQILNLTFGANFQFQIAAGPATNNSAATNATFVTLVTPDLPLGNYLLSARWQYSVANNNRSGIFELFDGVALLTSVEMPQPLSNTPEVVTDYLVRENISGIRTFTLQFRVGNNGGTTVTVTNGELQLWRVS